MGTRYLVNTWHFHCRIRISMPCVSDMTTFQKGKDSWCFKISAIDPLPPHCIQKWQDRIDLHFADCAVLNKSPGSSAVWFVCSELLKAEKSKQRRPRSMAKVFPCPACILQSPLLSNLLHRPPPCRILNITKCWLLPTSSRLCNYCGFFSWPFSILLIIEYRKSIWPGVVWND